MTVIDTTDGEKVQVGIDDGLILRTIKIEIVTSPKAFQRSLVSALLYAYFLK